jgi:hypothetical protein
MVCPHCHRSFPLSWGRYIRSPLGKHMCPECGESSRLSWTLSYFAFLIVAWVSFVTVAFLVTRWLWPHFEQTGEQAPFYVAVYLTGCVLIVPLDRWYDERFRKLEKPRSRGQGRG